MLHGTGEAAYDRPMAQESSAFAADPRGTRVVTWVVPRAKRTELAGLHAGAIRVRVANPPEDGKANRAVAELLRRSTGAKRCRLIQGARSRRKVFILEGVDPVSVGASLGARDRAEEG